MPNEIKHCQKENMNNNNQLACIECKKDFEFSQDEQAFYADKGFNNPKRCKPCRIEKKNKYEKREDLPILR